MNLDEKYQESGAAQSELGFISQIFFQSLRAYISAGSLDWQSYYSEYYINPESRELLACFSATDLECVTSVKETTSPFHSEAQRIPDDHRSKPSFFTRFCGCGNDEPTSEESSSNAASRQVRPSFHATASHP